MGIPQGTFQSEEGELFYSRLKKKAKLKFRRTKESMSNQLAGLVRHPGRGQLMEGLE